MVYVFYLKKQKPVLDIFIVYLKIRTVWNFYKEKLVTSDLIGEILTDSSPKGTL